MGRWLFKPRNLIIAAVIVVVGLICFFAGLMFMAGDDLEGDDETPIVAVVETDIPSATDIPPPTVAVVAIQPSETPEVDLAAEPDEPTEMLLPTDEPMEPMEEPTPTLEPTEAILPTATSAPFIPIDIPDSVQISTNCLATNAWVPFPSGKLSLDDDGCWVLDEFGMTLTSSGVNIAHVNEGPELEHAIYAPFEGDVIIEFDMVIEGLDVPEADRVANLSVGFIPEEQAVHPDGRLFYQREGPELSGFPIYIKPEDSLGLDSAFQRGGNDGFAQYDLGTQQHYWLEVRNGRLFGSVDQVEWINKPWTAERYVFWIGFRLSEGGEIKARVMRLNIRLK